MEDFLSSEGEEIYTGTEREIPMTSTGWSRNPDEPVIYRLENTAIGIISFPKNYIRKSDNQPWSKEYRKKRRRK